MHEDLRRRALESKKTTSNKAKSKPSSRASSRPNSKPGSRVGSRVQSRDASDDEGEDNGNLSDDTNGSINSIDTLLESNRPSEPPADIPALHECIEELLDRKSSNKRSREDVLNTFVHILTAHHLPDSLFGRVPELLGAFSRSVRAETSEQETVLALRAMAITSITCEDDSLWETIGPLIKRTISDSQLLPVKTAAIHCLGICITFGGAGNTEKIEAMTFLLEIARSDGAFVDAEDNGDVVRAALQEYGFLVTQVEDIEAESEDAIEVCLDQLNSSEVGVQIAAGENIALLYEKSYTPLREDEGLEDIEDTAANSESDEDPVEPGDLVKRYDAYHNAYPVIEKVTALAGLSTKAMHKRDKRNLHRTFASIAMTVENPKLGLVTHKTSDMKVRVYQDNEIKVNRWWKLMRLTAIRRLLTSGFVNHYSEGNPQLLEVLPEFLQQTTEGYGLDSPRKGGHADRFSDQRRFEGAEHADEGGIFYH